MVKIIAASVIMILSVSVTGTVQEQTPISVVKTADGGIKSKRFNYKKPKGFNYKEHYKKKKRIDRKRARKGIKCSWMP